MAAQKLAVGPTPAPPVVKLSRARQIVAVDVADVGKLVLVLVARDVVLVVVGLVLFVFIPTARRRRREGVP